MGKNVITRKDVLTPLSEFEAHHNIQETREDIPYQFLGHCPSKYYRLVDMNPAVLVNRVAKLLRRVYNRSF